jgi:hypothetical protein
VKRFSRQPQEDSRDGAFIPSNRKNIFLSAPPAANAFTISDVQYKKMPSIGQKLTFLIFADARLNLIA